jgi:molybdopterin molybdotransferase
MITPMLSWQAAREQVLANLTPLPAVSVPIAQSAGRVLAADLTALRTQPPADVSSMDGYAVSSQYASPYAVVGESAAGHAYGKAINKGEAVRIFTGAEVPDGADCIIIQEDVTREGNNISAPAPVSGKHIRKMGIDFNSGSVVLTKGTRLTPQILGLAAALNYKELPVAKAPRVAILSTGDELKEPGYAGEHDIVSTNALVLSSIAKDAGGRVTDHGIAPDAIETLRNKIRKILKDEPDILITSGGASVGDHDLVQLVLKELGMTLGFWKIAMRPGKPLIHGRIGKTHILGLPGNPVSSFVCGMIFMKPLIEALTGLDTTLTFETGILQTPLKANDHRAEFMRGRVEGNHVTVFDNQDSSLLSVLAGANALVYREVNEGAKAKGDEVKFIRV